MQASSRAALCNLVEDNLTALIREAATVQRHSRRARFRAVALTGAGAAAAAGGGSAAAAAAAASSVLPEGIDAAAALVGRSGAGGGSATAAGGGPKRRRLLHADDVNLALSYRGSAKLYLTNAGQLGPPTVANTAAADDDGAGAAIGTGTGTVTGIAGASTSMVKPKKKRTTDLTAPVDLNAYLRTEMTLRPPSEIGMRAHWLAVDGVQPDIPENPPPIGMGEGSGGVGVGTGVGVGVGVGVGSAGGMGGMRGLEAGRLPPGAAGVVVARGRVGGPGSLGGSADRTVHRVEDDEDLDAAAAVTDGPGSDKKDAGPTSGRTAASGGASAGAGGSTSGVSVRQLLPRLLSEELRLYFTRVTLAVERGTSPTQIDAALSALSRDSGIQELVPFFVRFLSQQIYSNVGRVEYCRTLVRMAASLVANPHLHLELNLHQLLPPLITCVVARRLAAPALGGEWSSDTSSKSARGRGGSGNHWALREEAADVLVAACSTFGEQYTTLKARVLRTLCEALSPDMPLTTQYGGLVGIARFGPKAVDAFLLPLATPYWLRWEEALKSIPGEDLIGRFELQQCQRALLEALASFMGTVNPEEQCERVDWDAMSEVFGEKLIPLRSEPSDYVQSFL